MLEKNTISYKINLKHVLSDARGNYLLLLGYHDKCNTNELLTIENCNYPIVSGESMNIYEISNTGLNEIFSV